MKHRTQILLEDWQYQALKEEAVLLKISFSNLIRKGIDQILTTRQNAKSSKKELLQFAGVIREKKHLSNRTIDQTIYRKDWK